MKAFVHQEKNMSKNARNTKGKYLGGTKPQHTL
jgi:hypothetical protein